MLATDRCDRCGAQAYALVELPAEDLHFCAHHWREHGPTLIAADYAYLDDTAALNSPAPDATHTPRATTLGDAGPS